MTTMKMLGEIRGLVAEMSVLEQRVTELENKLRGHNSKPSIRKTAKTPDDRVTKTARGM